MSGMGPRWTHWYRRILPAYWFFLFSATHLPKLSLPGGVSFTDKIAHAVAFGILAFLFWRFAETLHYPLSRKFVWIAMFSLGAYAAFDEWLQPLVGRGAEPMDWVVDVLGIALVLAVLERQRRRRVRYAARFPSA